MIDQVTVYQLTCQGCGTTVYKPWQDVRDVRVFVRGFGWWCADEAQNIDRKIVWHIRCSDCGEPTEDAQ